MSNIGGKMQRAAAMIGLGALTLPAGPVANAAPAAAATAVTTASIGGAGTGAMGELDVRFAGLRSSKGMLRACMTRNPTYYPKCERDPQAIRANIAANSKTPLSLDGVPPGDYALLVLHDENGNAKVDTMMGIPREGVGFSRNPRIMFGPPSFNSVRIHVPAGTSETDVKMQYFL